ncbi:MAG TPA: cytochrome P460 family protein [Vicinamibacterales bacterium]|nr:cytochrome P460 family protein [Vicinamibacterales bacterium]
MSQRDIRRMVAIVSAPLVAAIALAAAPRAGQGSGMISFPDGYRSWTHVKSTIVGPESASFATNGGLHHFYANPRAMEGYRSGNFADGAVLIDDLVELKANGGGVSIEGPRRRLAVMVKDSRRFADTGGWGFEIFKADTREGSLSTDGRNACFGCHKKADEGVFSSITAAEAGR